MWQGMVVVVLPVLPWRGVQGCSRLLLYFGAVHFLEEKACWVRCSGEVVLKDSVCAF